LAERRRWRRLAYLLPELKRVLGGELYYHRIFFA
jgi:hypothetical protein